MPTLLLHCVLIVTSLTLLTHVRVVQSQSFEHDPSFRSLELILKLVKPLNFAGKWNLHSVSKDSKAAISGFESTQGVMIIPMQRALMLFDGNDSFETRFVSIQLDIFGLIKTYKWIQRIEGERISYQTGDGLVKATILNSHECIMKEMTIIMMKVHNFEKLDSLTNEIHVVIQVSIVGGECPFNFSGFFVASVPEEKGPFSFVTRWLAYTSPGLNLILPNLVVVIYDLCLKDLGLKELGPMVAVLLIGMTLMAFSLRKKCIKRKERERYLVSAANVNPEDDCSICLAPLIPLNSNEGPITAVYRRWVQRYLIRIIKTNCGHTFHEKCLMKWLETKPECGLCRAPVLYLI